MTDRTIETEDVVALCQRLRLRFRHSAYLATDARLSTDPDCQEAADVIQSLSDRIDVLEGAVKHAHRTLVELKIARTLSECRFGGSAVAVSGVVNKLRVSLTKEAGIHGEGR